jgi:hypothetical protein
MPLRKRQASKAGDRPVTEPMQVQKERMKGFWPTEEYLKVLKIKQMPTYTHKPTGTEWNYWIINGKGVYINELNRDAVIRGDQQYIPMVPEAIVENGKDWVKIDYDRFEKKYSKQDISQAMARAFNTAGLSHVAFNDIWEFIRKDLDKNV